MHNEGDFLLIVGMVYLIVGTFVILEIYEDNIFKAPQILGHLFITIIFLPIWLLVASISLLCVGIINVLFYILKVSDSSVFKKLKSIWNKKLY